jgi:trehalose transport system substrate-binding protein
MTREGVKLEEVRELVRARSFVVLLSATLLLASACGAPESGEEGPSITFNVSLAEEEQAGIQEVIAAFTEQTGIQVRLSNVASENMPQKLQTEVDSGNNTIHLISMDNNSLAALVDPGLVQDVGDIEVPAEVNPALIPADFDGTTYFLPFRPNVRVAYINSQQFQNAGVGSPPATVEEYRAMAETFMQESGQPRVTVSLAAGTSAPVVISEWILAFGGEPVILNDQGSIEAMTFLQDMWNDGLLAEESLQGEFDTEIDNLRGETAWYAQNWPFTSGVFAEEGVLELFQVDNGWAGPAGEFHVIGGDVLGIPTGVEGQQRNSAARLAEFLMSQEAQSILAETNAWPSIRDDATQSVPAELEPTFTAVQEALANGWYRPSVAYWPDVQLAMDEVVRRILQEGEDVKTVLDELHAQVEQAAQATGDPYPPEPA